MTCPYCAAPDATPAGCPRCRRDLSAPRAICPACRRQTPDREPVCIGCGARRGSEMAWKLPLIIALFAAAVAASIALRAAA